MADNNFRSYRGRDSLAPDDVNSPAREGAADPLAELARLIGQTDPQGERGRYEDAAPGRDWPADDYADQYNRVQDRYVQPPPLPADPYPSRAPQPSGYENEPAASSRYFSGPAAKFGGFRQDGSDYVPVDDAQYGNEPVPPFVAAPSEHGYGVDEQEHHGDQAYGADDYNDEAPIPRRGGLVVVMAVLGLAVIGTAGAFGYRAMFGSSVLPTLPPIIKASNGPNKIVPTYGDAQANNQPGVASAGSTENLVSHEEQPVKMEPPKAPRVVSTIPISPGQSAAPAAPAAVAGLPAAASPGGPPPASTAAPPPPAAPAPASISSEPKKIHTVTIRADQPNSLGSAPVQPGSTARSAARPAAPAPKPSTTASAPAGGAPLSIIPGAEGDTPAAAPARARAAVAPASGAPMALASTTSGTAVAATSSAGGYAVQLTSQRSEAAAQAAFRSLQAKYPDQLGGREPILRRADLGAKGVYYRALVGPFASQEEAARMCSSLKTAGGDCNVQRN